MGPLRIMIVDDHKLMRQGLTALLSAESDFDVVGEASAGREALEEAERIKPDIMLLDLVLPDIHGLVVAERLREVSPDTRTLVLSMYSEEAYVVEALRNGVKGYVLKEASLEVLTMAVRVVADGKRYLCPPLSERAIDVYLQQPHVNVREIEDGLTNRELEVVRLAAQGLTSLAIAERLGISSRTAETHRARAMKKLKLRSQAELYQYALQKGPSFCPKHAT